MQYYPCTYYWRPVNGIRRLRRTNILAVSMEKALEQLKRHYPPENGCSGYCVFKPEYLSDNDPEAAY